MGQELSTLSGQSTSNDIDSSLANMSLEIGGKKVQMLKKIAEGGYSFVYLVQDVISPDEKYALKRMVATDSSQQRIIDQEIHIMKSLCTKNHPNFIKFYGHTTRTVNNSKETYVLMENCSRGSLVNLLQAHMDAKRPMSEDRIIRIFAQACAAIHSMHTSLSPPLAHRDLKIENILIGDDDRYKICDFGSCSSKNEIIQDTNVIVQEQNTIDRQSTITYRAPELCDLRRSRKEDWVVSPKADIWSLGCILYVLAYYIHPFEDGGILGILSGKVSFPGLLDPRQQQTLQQQQQQQLMSNSNSAFKYTNYVNYIISRCWTFNPTYRPSTGDLLELIKHWAAYLKTKQHNNEIIGTAIDTWVPRVIHYNGNGQMLNEKGASIKNNNNSNGATKLITPIQENNTMSSSTIKPAPPIPSKPGRQVNTQIHTQVHMHHGHTDDHNEFDATWSDDEESNNSNNSNNNNNGSKNINFDISLQTTFDNIALQSSGGTTPVSMSTPISTSTSFSTNTQPISRNNSNISNVSNVSGTTSNSSTTSAVPIPNSRLGRAKKLRDNQAKSAAIYSTSISVSTPISTTSTSTAVQDDPFDANFDDEFNAMDIHNSNPVHSYQPHQQTLVTTPTYDLSSFGTTTESSNHTHHTHNNNQFSDDDFFANFQT